MDTKEKFLTAIQTLRPNTEFIISGSGEIITEEDFNNIKWVTGVDDNGNTITTTINPHSEITWELLEAECDAKEYVIKRKAEYPSIQDLVVALYDTEDKIAIDLKRAEIKLKYPKPI
jgi:hypothetical protein